MFLCYRKYLIRPQSLPLHEVFYYNKVTDLRQHIDGCPRATIHRGLSSPYYYLQVSANNKTVTRDSCCINQPSLY